MQKLIAFAAPARFVFVDPDTKYQYEAATKEKLVAHIRGYREQNRLKPIESLDIILENYWCGLPENMGKCENLPKLKRGLLQYVKGGVALIENILMKKMVSPVEADARAKICTGCPHNIFPDKSAFVQWSDEIAEASTGGLRTELHDKLGNCEVCSCTLKAKVWFGGSLRLKPKEREMMKAVGCWQPEWERKSFHGKRL
jgi:hypothetical protein